MTKENKKELYGKLKNHHGSLTEIASRAKVSTPYVYRVLVGQRKSSKILTIACEVLLDYEKKEAERLKAQNEIMERVSQLAMSFSI